MKVCILIVMLYLHCCGTVNACGRTRQGPPQDRTKPSIKCPPDRTEYADPIQIHTKVWWNEDSVIVNDDRDRGIKANRKGPAPGQLFSEGDTKIQYHAKDKSGNYASCGFKVKVKVLRCKHLGKMKDGWKMCHPSDDMRVGTVCKFGCYTGHELIGYDRIRCFESEQWSSSKPYCKKVTCPRLFPSYRQVGIVDIVCTNSNNYRSICSYNCKKGYNVLPGKPNVRVCRGDGTWHGSVPECLDTDPPVFESCKYIVVGYTDRSKNTGRVSWRVPTATDNNGRARVSQIYGVKDGAELKVGEYTVRYVATDAAGNTATCELKVIMKQIKCHRLYPLPYTQVVCPAGRIFGSTCTFSCDKGSTLMGSESVMCLKTNTDVPSGRWTFIHQPYCENQNTCPDLGAPDNGALACDTWMYGRYCQMMCQEGFVVLDDPATMVNEVQIHEQLLVCGDSGSWVPDGYIPNCQEVSVRESLFLKMSIRYLYYGGVCDESRQDIQKNFLNAFTKATGITCKPPTCAVSKVKVKCGKTIRSSRRQRRDVITKLDFEVTMDISNNQSSTETAKLRSSIRTSLYAGLANDSLDLNIDGNSTTLSGIEVGHPEATCDEGNAYIRSTFECVKCNKGYYHDILNDVCAPCPRGQYQDESQQTSCKLCPAGTTTKTKGAFSLSQCEEACPAGYNSTTGTYPCSACDIGWYNEHNGSIECIPCQGSKITLRPGAVSPAQCKEFDITYSEINDTETLVAASMNIDDSPLDTFSLTFFVKCEQCDNIVCIARTDGQTVVSVTNTDQLQIEFDGKQYETEIDLTGSMMWKQITVVNTGVDIILYLNDEEILREDISNHSTDSTGSLNCTIGGEGFVGSISQLNMWSNISAFLPIATDTCFDTIQGDLISWNEVSELEGSFVLTESACDVDDNCKTSPCLNNGKCTDSNQTFYCTCLSGFTGHVCEINIDDCYENPCDNNATCIDGEDRFTCNCPDHFTGELCETYFVDGGWTEWEVRSGCSVTCGSGVQQLSRVCENPLPVNGGKQCDGDRIKTIVCETNTTCINECLNDPMQIENGSLNCDWSDNETRVCKPSCDEGFDFDSVQFIETSGIICGPETGYTWNINNPDNPLSQLPSCTRKFKALENKVNFTAMYNMTLTEMDSGVEYEIKDKVNSKVAGTGCLSTGNCTLAGIHVYLSEKVDAKNIMFTTEINCYVTGEMDGCYDLLAEVLTTLNSYIEQQQLTIQHGGNAYDVIVNSSSLSGESVCEPGHIPVWQYCVSCGKGTFATFGYCEHCPRGYYQDEEAQTTCKQCPDGWTTAGTMTRDKVYCNVVISDSVVMRLFITIVTAVSIGIVCLVAFVAFFLFKRLALLKNKTYSTVKGNKDEGNLKNVNPQIKSSTTESSFCYANSNLPGLSALKDMPPVLTKYSVWSYGLTKEILKKSIKARSHSTSTDGEDLTDSLSPTEAGTAEELTRAVDNPTYESTSCRLDHTALCNTNLPGSPPQTDIPPVLSNYNVWSYGLTSEDVQSSIHAKSTNTDDTYVTDGKDLNDSKDDTRPETIGECTPPKTTGESETPETTVESITPETTGEIITPETTGESITPETTGESITPQTTGESITPETTGESITPETTGESITPETMRESITPETTRESITPETTAESHKSFQDKSNSTSTDNNGSTNIGDLNDEKGLTDVEGLNGENRLTDIEDMNGEKCLTDEKDLNSEKRLTDFEDLNGEKGLADVEVLNNQKRLTNIEELNGEKGLTYVDGLNSDKGSSNVEDLKGEKDLTSSEDLNAKNGLAAHEDLAGERSLTDAQGLKEETDLNCKKGLTDAEDLNGEKDLTEVEDLNREKGLTYVEDMNEANRLTNEEDIHKAGTANEIIGTIENGQVTSGGTNAEDLVLTNADDPRYSETCNATGVEKSDKSSTDGKGLTNVEFLEGEKDLTNAENLNGEKGLTNNKDLNKENGVTNVEDLDKEKYLSNDEDLKKDEKRLTDVEPNCEKGLTDVVDVTGGKGLTYVEALNYDTVSEKVEDVNGERGLTNTKDLDDENGLTNDEDLSDKKGLTDVEQVTYEKGLTNVKILNFETVSAKVEVQIGETVLDNVEVLMDENGLAEDEYLNDEKDGPSK